MAGWCRFRHCGNGLYRLSSGTCASPALESPGAPKLTVAVVAASAPGASGASMYISRALFFALVLVACLPRSPGRQKAASRRRRLVASRRRLAGRAQGQRRCNASGTRLSASFASVVLCTFSPTCAARLLRIVWRLGSCSGKSPPTPGNWGCVHDLGRPECVTRSRNPANVRAAYRTRHRRRRSSHWMLQCADTASQRWTFGRPSWGIRQC